MSTVEKIGISIMGIGHMIKNHKVSVPKYQRSYAWESKNVLDLLNDLNNAISQNFPEYFLGSIVTKKGEDSWLEVVDGQQRLATITILIASIRNHFKNKSDHQRANQIENDYLLSKSLDTLVVNPKLRLNDADKEFFEKRILSNIDLNNIVLPPKSSHSKIEKAVQDIKAYLDDICRKSGDDTSTLVKWITFIESKLRIILVEVPDDINAFTIFETLNDRGLALAISDLLKNYLFNMSGPRLSDAQEKWVAMSSIIETISTDEIIVTFIRHLWSSMNGPTREKYLYSEIKKSIINSGKVVEFLDSLVINARPYVAILNPNHEFWQKYTASTRGHMQILNMLRMIQVRPLILAILDKFNAEHTSKSLKLLVAFSVRLLIHGGLGGGVIEDNYCNAAVEIRQNKIKTANQLLNKLRSILPTDTEFKRSFEIATVSKNYLARYYLQVLERQANKEESPELVLNENPDEVNLEHIMPLNKSDEWNHIEDEDYYANIKRIGNMALLKYPDNVDIGNMGFAEKKRYYRKSKITLTKVLKDKLSWNINEIESRQAELALLALKAWPLKV